MLRAAMATPGGSVGGLRAEMCQREILKRAHGRGLVRVTELADALHVTTETIRRDMRELSERGLMERVHGGARPIEALNRDLTARLGSGPLLGERRRIAAVAAQRLGDAKSVYLDEGATCGLLAEALVPMSRSVSLTVVTPSLLVAGALAGNPRVEVYLLGGRLGRGLATCGQWAASMLAEVGVDLAFIGSDRISVGAGVTTCDPAAVSMKSLVVRNSKRRVLAAVHTKLGATGSWKYAEVDDFDAIITGSELPKDDARRYQARGPHVTRV